MSASLKSGTLRSFNSNSYTASVCLDGSRKACLDGVRVARNLPALEMTQNRKVAVVFFDESNAGEAVVVAVYT